MGRYSGKTCRLLTMLGMTTAFFLVEIVVGYVTNSVALVADSFHMLSDVVALIVGFASVRISKWRTQKNTFGWARAEVLGALVNAVFLIALCFSILVEALKRLVKIEEIKDPKLLLIVGALGLGVNLIGLFLFQSHGHSHGGHSHGGHSHASDDHTENDELMQRQLKSNGTGMTSQTLECEDDSDNVVEIEIVRPTKSTASSSQLNMRGVFLHVLGDAMGSVIVIISALVIWFGEGNWVFYIDPGMRCSGIDLWAQCMTITMLICALLDRWSLIILPLRNINMFENIVMVCIILSTTIPLLKESGFILLQTVPTHIQVGDIKEKIEKITGVLAVHEFHVWQLAGNRIIASAHVRCHNLKEYMSIASTIKDLFHNEGIHSTTIQPEFVELDEVTISNSSCMLECGPDKKCYSDTCCPIPKSKSFTEQNSSTGLKGTVRHRGVDSINEASEHAKESDFNDISLNMDNNPDQSTHI